VLQPCVRARSIYQDIARRYSAVTDLIALALGDRDTSKQNQGSSGLGGPSSLGQDLSLLLKCVAAIVVSWTAILFDQFYENI